MSDQQPAERWTRLTALFDRASELPEAARAAYLDDACGDDNALRRELDDLLRFDAGSSTRVDEQIHRVVKDTTDSVTTPVIPLERIGPYRLVREIGRGGMGAVYLAQRDDDFNQQVAIKLVNGLLGAEALRRFRSERQMLASLEHPGIARLLDGGTTPHGMPYLVMEFVDGVPIDRYCDSREIRTRDRVALFLKVCDAVSAAHRSLIVHRDLKPSNILVTSDGTPKLLDFGIAKLLEHDSEDLVALTTPSMRIMTPHFASPEQVTGDVITTASDVYSLGVLLYTLLTGARPYELASRDPDVIQRMVCHEEPPKPSAVPGDDRRSRELRGDLDTIILTALQKEPARRFASVDLLAQDLRRYLDGHPVLARRSTVGYRTRRFVRRHRGGVAAAAVFVLTVIGFAIAVAISAAQARRERDAAERVTQMLIQTFSGSDPRSLNGDIVTARELLDRGADRVRNDLRDQPALQARLFGTLGAIYSGLGLSDRAEAVLNEAMQVREGEAIADSQPTARTMMRLATSLADRGQFADAETMARSSFEMTKRLVGTMNPQVGEALITLGTIVNAAGRDQEAERLFMEATQIFRETLGPEHPMVGFGLQNTAKIRFARGDYAESERMANEALMIQQKVFGLSRAESLSIVARIRVKQGRLEDAEAGFRQSADLLRQGYGKTPHPLLEKILLEQADVTARLGDAAAADRLRAESKSLTDIRSGARR